MDWSSISQQLSAALGRPFQVERESSIGGGCINAAWRIEGGGQHYFVKLNSANRLDMFAAEMEGLQAMAAADAIRVPEPICYGAAGAQSFLVMEYLELGGGGGNVMAEFGRQMSGLHRHTRADFGWSRDNTIGSTHQPNTPEHDWLTFWRQQRLGFQLELAARAGAGGRLLNKGDKLLDGMGAFFTDYQPVASALHGDLWSGNYAILHNGEAVIFDPAFYFGDREADLAMTELFGGFGRDFYAAYSEAWPLDSGYPVRKTLYNLYHILNHFTMFGGGYGSQAESMIDRLLGEIH
ncbi:MAG: fructosamine kinase family protein [Gammaproteobacteria bacterium]|nr:fructosamine kinase family protein [Gammaproteobacteria bacterium]